MGLRIVGLAIAASVALPGLARADGLSTPFGAMGPGTGKGAIALGVGALALEPFGGPTVPIHAAYGVADPVDVFASVRPGAAFVEGTSLFTGFFEAGLLVRVTPRADDFAMGLRFSPTLAVFANGEASVVFVAMTPGIPASVGTDRVQLHLGVDVPIFFYADLGRSSGTFLEVTMRPKIEVAGGVGEGLKLYLGVAPTITFGRERLSESALFTFEAHTGVVF